MNSAWLVSLGTFGVFFLGLFDRFVNKFAVDHWEGEMWPDPRLPFIQWGTSFAGMPGLRGPNSAQYDNRYVIIWLPFYEWARTHWDSPEGKLCRVGLLKFGPLAWSRTYKVPI